MLTLVAAIFLVIQIVAHDVYTENSTLATLSGKVLKPLCTDGRAVRLLRARAIVLRIMPQIAKAEFLHERRNVDSEATGEAFLKPVPAADGIAG